MQGLQLVKTLTLKIVPCRGHHRISDLIVVSTTVKCIPYLQIIQFCDLSHDAGHLSSKEQFFAIILLHRADIKSNELAARITPTKRVAMNAHLLVIEVIEALLFTSGIAMVSDFVKNGENAYTVTLVFICLGTIFVSYVTLYTLYMVVHFVIHILGETLRISASGARTCLEFCSAVRPTILLQIWLIQKYHKCNDAICQGFTKAHLVAALMMNRLFATCQDHVPTVKHWMKGARTLCENSVKTYFWPTVLQAQPTPILDLVLRIPALGVMARLDDEAVEQAKQRLIDCSSVFRQLDRASQSNVVLSIVAEIEEFSDFDHPAHSPHRTFSLAAQMLDFQFTNDIFELYPIYTTREAPPLNVRPRSKIFAVFITLVFLIRYEFALAEQLIQSEETVEHDWPFLNTINDQAIPEQPSTSTDQDVGRVTTLYRRQRRDSGYDSPHWHVNNGTHIENAFDTTIQ